MRNGMSRAGIGVPEIGVPDMLSVDATACVGDGCQLGSRVWFMLCRFHLTESVYKVVLQKSVHAQTRQLIL